MTVKELINLLLDKDMNLKVRIFYQEKGNTEDIKSVKEIYKILYISDDPDL